jgi:serine/threonine protein kinase
MPNPRVHSLPADHDKFPRRLGPYVIVSFVGEGGMGSVYLAVMGPKEAAKLCVIKQLGSAWSDFPADELPAIKGRFKREAEITMALSHPSIPKTFAVGDEQGPYLVQDLIDGLNLRYLVPRVARYGESIAVPLASYIVVEVAKALAYLHDFEARGLVHRDVTPDNVMLAANGEVKLIDFGIAKATTVDDSLTKRGVVGKADWTAPEIFHGAKLDRRADIYGLGLLYWYILTHRDPGDTKSRHAGTSDKLLPVSSFTLLASPELDRVVARAMDANPDFRFQTAADLQKAASQFIPEGFDGKAEVASLIFRNTSRLGDGLYPRLLEQGRPLLDDVPAPEMIERRRVVDSDATEVMKPRNWHRLVLFALGAAIVLGVGVLVTLKGGKKVEVTDVAPVQPPSPAVVPPEPKPEPGPRLEPKPDPAAGSRPATSEPGHPPVSPAILKTATPQPKIAPEPQIPRSSADELLASAKSSFEAERFSEALNMARSAANQGAGAKAFVIIGSCLSLKKDYVGAREALERALRLSPEDVDAKRLLKRLRLETGGDTQ